MTTCNHKPGEIQNCAYCLSGVVNQQRVDIWELNARITELTRQLEVEQDQGDWMRKRLEEYREAEEMKDECE